jgi:glycosyltransferase involved in cell wall biosynthesis
MTNCNAEQPLRIGFFSPALPDSGETNGIVTYVRIMRDALRSLGHSVVVVTTDHIERDGEVSRIPPPSKARLLLESLRRADGSSAWVRSHVLNAFAAARSAGVDLFEIEESHGWAARLTGVPIVMRLHGPHCFVNDGEVDQGRAKAELSAFWAVSAVTSPTEALLDAMSERGAHARLARVIPNPIPLPIQEWNVANTDPDQILFVGRVDHVKGVDLAIHAFTKALERRPALKLLIVGPGVPVEAPSGVQFMGRLSAEAIQKLRLQSCLYLCSSRFENFPYVIAEAMALGMPVLSSATFGAMALIQDGVTGRIVSRDFADAMLNMLDDRSRLAEMGAAARKSVRDRLDPVLIAAESVSLYREIAQQPGAALGSVNRSALAPAHD